MTDVVPPSQWRQDYIPTLDDWQAALASSGVSPSYVAQAVTDGIVGKVDRSSQRGTVNALDMGAMGDGVSDDTAALNATIAAAGLGGRVRIPAGTYMVREAFPGAGYALLNPGTNIAGDRGKTIIAPLPSMPNTADFMLIRPPTGAEIDFLELRDFYIYPNLSRTARGKRGLFFDFSGVCNVSRMRVADIYCTPGTALSLEITNNVINNPQGCPSNSVIERNALFEGMRLSSIGDSVTIRNNTIRSTDGTGRTGIDLSVVDGTGGQASHAMIEQNNIACSGGGVLVRNGRNVKVLHNNIEQLVDGGTSHAAVIDMSGATDTLVWPEVRGNHVAIFGTSTAQHAITLTDTVGGVVDGNTILAGFPIANAAIIVGVGSSDAVIGFNEISSSYATSVDASLSTRARNYRYGLNTSNGFAAVGVGSALPAWWMDRDGIVHLEGLLSCPATPNGMQIATLPASVRPLSGTQSYSAYAVVSAAVSPQGVTVDTAGAVKYVGSNSATQISLNGIAFTTQAHVFGDL